MRLRMGSQRQPLPRLLVFSSVLAGLVILGNLAVLLLMTNASYRLVFIDVTYPLWDLWAVLGLGYAAWSSMRQAHRLALAWGCMAVAAFCSGIGNSLWGVMELGYGNVAFPSAADAFYLLVSPLFLCGVLLLPAPRANWRERLQTALDIVMVMLTATLFFWRYVFAPAVASADSLAEQLVALAYPVSDLVLLWAVLMLLYRGTDKGQLGPLLLLAFATGITIMADGVYSVQMLRETYVSAGLLDIAWVVTALLYGIAGIRQATGQTPTAPDSFAASSPYRHTWLAYLPYACAISTYFMLESTHGQGKQLGTTWLTWGVGLLILLVLLRQMMTLQENRQQAQTLLQMNHILHAEIHERQQVSEQVQRYTHTLESLNRIHLSLADELDLEKLVQLVTDVATDLSGAAFGAFFYNHYHQDRESYLLYALSGASKEMFAHFPLPRSTHLFGPTFRGEGCIRLDDVTQDPRYGSNPPYRGMPDGHLSVRSYLAVPVRTAQGEVIGGLFFGHSEPGIFTEQAENLIVGIAAQAGVAVQKARLYTQLREREERFRHLIEDASDGILAGDQAGVCQEANTALSSLLGYKRDELVGRQLKELILPEDALQLVTVLERLQLHQVHTAEWHFLRRDGTPLLVEISIKLLSNETWQAIVRDITERKHKEAQVRQQDRLAVVGQLAAGIAHDFNNSLAIILLQTQMAQLSPDLSAKEKQRLQIINEQSRHSAHLVSQILDFSRQSVLEYQLVDLPTFLTNIIDLLKHTLPKQIFILFTCETEQAWIKADVTRLQQVLMNLAINARDAMPEGGRLHLHLSLQNIAEESNAPLSGMVPGIWVCLAVTDTGEGIVLEHLPHIFEPFFSTKGRHKGTGLGLAQVHGIIQQHGGFIHVTSQPARGTSFFIYLPALSSPVHPDASESDMAIMQSQNGVIPASNENELAIPVSLLHMPFNQATVEQHS